MSASPAYDRLSNAHKRFVDEYIIDCVATDAARRSGYEASTSSKLMDDPGIKAAIEERLGEVRAQNTVAAGRVIDEMGRIAFANILDYVSIGADGQPFTTLAKMTREQAAAIQEITIEDLPGGKTKVKIKNHDKLAALQSLGKNLGLFTEWQKRDEGENDRGYSARELIESRLSGIAQRIGTGEGT